MVSKCPYRPKTGAYKPGAVCPFRDETEESAIEAKIDQALTNGMQGMMEMSQLARSGEMIMLSPLWRAVKRVLAILNDNDLNESCDNMAYVNEMGVYLWRITNWEECDHVVRENYTPLLTGAIRVLTTMNSLGECTTTFANILLVLERNNREAFTTYMIDFKRCEHHIRLISALEYVSTVEEWTMRGKYCTEFLARTMSTLSHSP